MSRSKYFLMLLCFSSAEIGSYVPFGLESIMLPSVYIVCCV
uniref:Uncharacterized protein n=1 Tax=Arundo donax TaxID=35708 RepID=A0A0A9C0S8_ARUDO